MNWGALGAVAEFVGATAVVATLIYLTIQVKQNKESIDANTRTIRVPEPDDQSKMPKHRYAGNR